MTAAAPSGASPKIKAVRFQLGSSPGRKDNDTRPELGAGDYNHDNYYEVLSDEEEDVSGMPAQAGGEGG